MENMFKGKTDVNDIIDLIIEKINELGGFEKAFLVSETGEGYSGYAVLYSGPNRKELYEFIIGSEKSNEKRADDQAKEKEPPAIRLDDSAIGKYLFEENDIYECFYHKYTDIKGETNKKKANKEILAVMKAVSAMFVGKLWGNVETAVCGADRERVFYSAEVPVVCDSYNIACFVQTEKAKTFINQLFENDDIKTINNVDIEYFRSIYKEYGLEKTYQAICQAELQSRLKLAKQTKNLNLYIDYLDRKELFELNRIVDEKNQVIIEERRKPLLSKAERIKERELLINIFKATVCEITKPLNNNKNLAIKPEITTIFEQLPNVPVYNNFSVSSASGLCL